MSFSKFIELHNRQQNLSLKYFCHSQKISYSYLPSLSIPISSPRKPLSIFKICHFRKFYINKLIQYLVLCVWLLSLSIMFFRFIHFVAVSLLHSFVLSNDIPLYGYTTFFNLIIRLWTFELYSLFVYCK